MSNPRYITKANRILAFIQEQPEHTWNDTQRALCEQMHITQPELSLLVKLLVEEGKVQKGNPLPGVRGRNFTLTVIDATPLEGPVRRVKPVAPAPRSEIYPREVEGSIDLRMLNAEQIGAAVLRNLQQYWEKEAEFNEAQSQQLSKIREFREMLTMERQTRLQLTADRERLATERDTLKRQIQDREQEIGRIRGELNRVLLAAHSRQQSGGNSTYSMRDVLSEEDWRVLDGLIRETPGRYRESDSDVGLVS